MMRLLQKKQENPFKYKIQMRSASERAERNKGLSLSGKIDSIFFCKKNYYWDFWKKSKPEILNRKAKHN